MTTKDMLFSYRNDSQLVSSSHATSRSALLAAPRAPSVVTSVNETEDSLGEIRLLSGPPNVTKLAEKEYKAFRQGNGVKRNMLRRVASPCEEEGFQLHDRFFISDGISLNLPPLNTILAGSKGEILGSEIRADDFDDWWATGKDPASIDVDAESGQE